MEGDSRFRKMKLQRINVRKVIRLWADKERMNLLRMTRAKIPCPRPLKIKQHILIMSFIGTACAARGAGHASKYCVASAGSDGVAAPQLREVELSAAGWRKAYTQVCLLPAKRARRPSHGSRPLSLSLFLSLIGRANHVGHV